MKKTAAGGYTCTVGSCGTISYKNRNTVMMTVSDIDLTVSDVSGYFLMSPIFRQKSSAKVEISTANIQYLYIRKPTPGSGVIGFVWESRRMLCEKMAL
jgi:hypothetical protein